jgi:hypothetical protein
MWLAYDLGILAWLTVNFLLKRLGKMPLESQPRHETVMVMDLGKI